MTGMEKEREWTYQGAIRVSSHGLSLINIPVYGRERESREGRPLKMQ